VPSGAGFSRVPCFVRAAVVVVGALVSRGASVVGGGGLVDIEASRGGTGLDSVVAVIAPGEHCHRHHGDHGNRDGADDPREPCALRRRPLVVRRRELRHRCLRLRCLRLRWLWHGIDARDAAVRDVLGPLRAVVVPLFVLPAGIRIPALIRHRDLPDHRATDTTGRSEPFLTVARPVSRGVAPSERRNQSRRR
jgi:hypothetical protein